MNINRNEKKGKWWGNTSAGFNSLSHSKEKMIIFFKESHLDVLDWLGNSPGHQSDRKSIGHLQNADI